MSSGWILGMVVLMLVAFSVRERVRQRLYRDKDWTAIGESKSSPLSEALGNLVGVAGGIYLSLVVVTTFVELQLPHRVQMAGLSLEPLATVSILMALLQPFLQKVLIAWRKV